MGRALEDAPFLGIKPQFPPPKEFTGEHADMDHFLGDCDAYFDYFQAYYPYDSQKVAFASSLFAGHAKDWWVYKRPDYFDPVLRRTRLPNWGQFGDQIRSQFANPAVEQTHEKRMMELRMGNGPATTFFQNLEIQAKLAGLADADGRQEKKVLAMRLGIPQSYTCTIINQGIGMPKTYPEWKARVLDLYEERQMQAVFEQTVG